MKSKTILQLDESDFAKANTLHAAGVPIGAAAMLIYLLACEKPQTVTEICRGAIITNVSEAASYLLERGWISCMKAPNARPGRNLHVYAAKFNLKQIADMLDEDNDRRRDETKRLLKRLVI